MSLNIKNFPMTAMSGKGGMFICGDGSFCIMDEINSHNNSISFYDGVYTEEIVESFKTRKMFKLPKGVKSFEKYEIKDYSNKNYKFFTTNMKSVELNDLIKFGLIKGKEIPIDRIISKSKKNLIKVSDEQDFFLSGMMQLNDNKENYSRISFIEKGVLYKTSLNNCFKLNEYIILKLNDMTIVINEKTKMFFTDFNDISHSDIRFKSYPKLFELSDDIFVYVDSTNSFKLFRPTNKDVNSLYEFNLILNSNFVCKPNDLENIEYSKIFDLHFSDKTIQNAKRLINNLPNQDFNNSYLEIDSYSDTKYALFDLGVCCRGLNSKIVLLDIQNQKYIGHGILPYHSLDLSSEFITKGVMTTLVSCIDTEIELSQFIDKYIIDFKDFNYQDDQYYSIINDSINEYKKLSNDLKVIDGLIHPIQNFKPRLETKSFIHTIQAIF